MKLVAKTCFLLALADSVLALSSLTNHEAPTLPSTIVKNLQVPGLQNGMDYSQVRH